MTTPTVILWDRASQQYKYAWIKFYETSWLEPTIKFSYLWTAWKLKKEVVRLRKEIPS